MHGVTLRGWNAQVPTEKPMPRRLSPPGHRCDRRDLSTQAASRITTLRAGVIARDHAHPGRNAEGRAAGSVEGLRDRWRRGAGESPALKFEHAPVWRPRGSEA
jgi:hypothetical protein